ncbi:MFS general substrate transporter [Amylocystis lapponica]|nr:MFS general substrate transporter [Amylocystis lapponica]
MNTPSSSVSQDIPVLVGPKPWGLKWRSSVWFITTGSIATDLLIYSVIIPVLPFQLEHLGYRGVSGLVGWLLFAYSAGLVIFTPPIAYLSEHYNMRWAPLISGLVALVCSEILLMEAPKFWVMVIARIIQGISSSVVWIVGLALLCDTVPEKYVGRQLGFAMAGLSIGFLVGPPVSGALYDKFGFRGPFIFGIGVTLVDLIGRLLIIERKTALRWGIDPAATASKDIETPQEDAADVSDDTPRGSVGGENSNAPTSNTSRPSTLCSSRPADVHQVKDAEKALSEASPGGGCKDVTAQPQLSLMTLLVTMVKSPRACSVFICTLSYGYSRTSLPLHLQKVWHLTSSKVGLVYIASVVPGLFSSVLSGLLVDNIGPAWVAVLCLIFAFPWSVLLIVQRSLVLFIVCFGIMNFFLSGAISPITAELAAATKGLDGVGYAHVYGAFNLAYGLGSALGPIIGSQIYEHVPRRGWMALCLLATGTIVICLVLVMAFFEETPMFVRAWRKCNRPSRA